MEITGNDAAAAGLADSNARSPAKRLLDQARVLARSGSRERTHRRVLEFRDQALRPPVLASLVAGELGCAGELEQAPATLPALVTHGHPACLSSPRHPAATLKLSGAEVFRRAARASPCYPAKGRRCEER